MSIQEYDVIVVGAGPAGAVCARFLGLAGSKVLLIDKEYFPRDKPCGDFLSSRLCERLKKVGLYEPLHAAAHCPIDDLLFTHPSAGSFQVKSALNREVIPGMMCRRIDLDRILFEEAKKHVDVLEGVKIHNVLFENGQVVGVQSEQQTFKAKIVVGADGANGVIAKSLGVKTMDENHHAAAVRGYYTGIKGLTSSVELHFIDEVQPGYFWIFPTNLSTGEANIGLGILSSHVRNRNVQLKKMMEKVIHEHPQFREQFTQATSVAPVKGWSLPFGSKKRSLAFAGALLIGDAGGLIDPMSGEGIENAFRSAECAAEHIQKALLAKNYSKTSLQSYENALEKLLRPELRKGYLIQKTSRNPTILKILFHLLKRSKICRKIIANKFF